MDSRIQVRLEEDGDGSSRQNWMENSGLWLYDLLLAVARHKITFSSGPSSNDDYLDHSNKI